MRKTIIAATTAAILGLVPLAATYAASPPPSPGSAGIGDPYFPQDGNGGYDVSHYAISIGYSPSSRSLTGHTVVQALAKQSLSRFDLDLVGLTLDSLRVNGQPATWSRTEHELRVVPKHALQKGSTFTVDARYHGKPLLLEETALGAGGWFNTPDGAVVVGQPPSPRPGSRSTTTRSTRRPTRSTSPSRRASRPCPTGGSRGCTRKVATRPGSGGWTSRWPPTSRPRRPASST